MEALDILVNQLFDYSGMFPPESKSFADAIIDSASFSSKLNRPFMIGADIVLSFTELKNLSQQLLINSGHKANTAFKVAVLGSKIVGEKSDFIDESLYLKNVFHGFDKINAQICSYEIKVANHALTNSNLFENLIESFNCPIAIEPDLSQDNWHDTLSESVKIISKHKDKLTLKIRGTGPAAINTDKIAVVIYAVSKAKINLKATGGLHHPVIEAARYSNNLGFLNLGVALYLSHAHQERFTSDDIIECLLCDNSSKFTLNSKLSFKNFSVSLEQLSLLKSSFKFGIGSCSLTEPDSDLCRLFDNE